MVDIVTIVIITVVALLFVFAALVAWKWFRKTALGKRRLSGSGRSAPSKEEAGVGGFVVNDDRYYQGFVPSSSDSLVDDIANVVRELHGGPVFYRGHPLYPKNENGSPDAKEATADLAESMGARNNVSGILDRVGNSSLAFTLTLRNELQNIKKRVENTKAAIDSFETYIASKMTEFTKNNMQKVEAAEMTLKQLADAELEHEVKLRDKGKRYKGIMVGGIPDAEEVLYAKRSYLGYDKNRARR